jgi:hypothetical protein
MARIHEVAEVAPENQTRWLAGQIDELEANLIVAVTELSGVVKSLTTELTTTREQMGRSSQRIVYTVLSASITLLVSVVVVVISGAMK